MLCYPQNRLQMPTVYRPRSFHQESSLSTVHQNWLNFDNHIFQMVQDHQSENYLKFRYALGFTSLHCSCNSRGLRHLVPDHWLDLPQAALCELPGFEKKGASWATSLAPNRFQKQALESHMFNARERGWNIWNWMKMEPIKVPQMEQRFCHKETLGNFPWLFSACLAQGLMTKLIAQSKFLSRLLGDKNIGLTL